MDLVEEFLELGNQVSVTTLMKLLACVQRRFPRRLIPKSMVDLLNLKSGNIGNNGPAKFWAWLARQQWRKMLPATFQVDVIMFDPAQENPNHVSSWPMFLPSETFSSIYKYDWRLFEQRFLGKEGSTDLSKCVPLAVHGDDAESHRRRSFTITTVSSLLTGGSPWDSRLLIYCMDTARATDSTYDVLDSWVVHSLTELQLGVFLDVDAFGRPWPDRPNKGQPIAGGWRGVICCHKGDEKYLARAYHTNTSWQSKYCCWLCRASRTNPSMLYTLHGRFAPHRATACSTESFIVSGCKGTPWVRLPGFHVQMLSNDYLHITDLALIPDAAASALVELTSTDLVWQGDNQDERLRRAHVEFVAECRRHKIRNRGQVFSMQLRGICVWALFCFTSSVGLLFWNPRKHLTGAASAYPSITQKHFNGAEAAILARWLAGITLAVACANPLDEYAQLRAAIFVNLAAMRRILSQEGVIMTPAALKDLERANYLYHAALNGVARACIDNDKLLYKIRPKGHKLDHLVLDQAPKFNPLWASTYGDEDMVGRIKDFARRSHPNQLGRQVLDRYAAYCCCRWMRKL
ncbi:unnamed protein product [Effrenium voratum]|nr:unnamed protein product [Effrenium voratum]